jgi:hypothetical protein
MVSSILRNTAWVAAFVIGATISSLVAPMLLSARGAIGPGIIHAESIPLAALAVVISLGVSTGFAIVIGRICNTAVGMFVLGGGLFGLARRTATIEEIAFGHTVWPIAVETVLWSVLVLLATMAVFRFAGPLRDIEPDEDGRTPHPFFSVDAIKLAVSGAVVVPVVWILAQSTLKGQAIGAAFVGAAAAGIVGRLVAPHVQPILLFATAVLFGAVGQAIGALLLGSADLPAAFAAGEIPTVCMPMSIDYACGSMMGVAFGLGAAKSFLHHEEHEADAQAATTS